jgi:dienelactone hydrolase
MAASASRVVGVTHDCSAMAGGGRGVKPTRLTGVIALALSTLVVSACGTSSDDESQGTASARGEQVTFEASDGVKLVGRIFGGGEVGVVLAHMGRPGDTQKDWYGLARALAKRGYAALTYNRRGVCTAPGFECSGGIDNYASSWKDVVAAADSLHERGVRDLALVGSSIGAMASLYALVTKSVEAAALVELAGVNYRSGYKFSREQLETLEGDKLFVSSAEDTYSAVFAAREWHRWAREPKQLVILPGSAHGTDMLIATEPTARPLMNLLQTFLTRAVPPR